MSLGTYERTLAIVNSLAWATEERGFDFSVDQNAGRIRIKGHGGSVALRITERLEDAWRTKESSYGESAGREKIKAPTGQLRLFMEATGGGSVEVADDGEQQLEEKLNTVFVKVYRAVVRGRASEREWARWRQEQEEQKRLREEEERVRLEKHRIAEEEKRRRSELGIEAQAWKTSLAIREYVEHVTVSAQTLTPALAEWKEWALRVAEELDPTLSRIQR